MLSDEELFVIEIPDDPGYLFDENHMVFRNIDGEAPALRLANVELVGRREKVMGTDMFFRREEVREEVLSQTEFGGLGNSQSSISTKGRYAYSGKATTRVTFEAL